MKDWVDSIIENGATKYILFISEFFLLGFVIILLGFKNALYNLDGNIIIILSVIISTIISLIIRFSTYVVWFLLGIENIKSELKTTEYIYALLSRNEDKNNKELNQDFIRRSLNPNIINSVDKDLKRIGTVDSNTNSNIQAFTFMYIGLLLLPILTNYFETHKLVLSTDIKYLINTMIGVYFTNFLIFSIELQKTKKAIRRKPTN